MMDIRLMLMIHIKFSVNWWDSLKIDPIISQLNKGFPPLVPRAIVQKSRSHSSLDSVQVAGKSSRELKDLALQLLLQLEKLEEEEKVSPASSATLTSHYPFDPFQDSQDPTTGYTQVPYEGFNLDDD